MKRVMGVIIENTKASYLFRMSVCSVMILVASYILYTSNLYTLLAWGSFAVLLNNIARLVKDSVLISQHYRIISIESQPKKILWMILASMILMLFMSLRNEETVWKLVFAIILVDGLNVEWRRNVILVNDYAIKKPGFAFMVAINWPDIESLELDGDILSIAAINKDYINIDLDASTETEKQRINLLFKAGNVIM